MKNWLGHYHFVETVVFRGVHLHQSNFVGRILGSAGVVPHHFVEIWWTHFVEGRGPAHKKCVQNACCHLVTNSPSTKWVLQSLQNGEAQPLHSQEFSLQNGSFFFCPKNMLTKFAQSLLRPGAGCASPFCRRLRCPTIL